MASSSARPINNIIDALDEIEKLLGEAITQAKTPGNNVADKVTRANRLTDQVLTNKKIEMQDFENLVRIYQTAKQKMISQRTSGTNLERWETRINNKEAELVGKKAIIDKEKFDKTKAVENEKNKRNQIIPEIEKRKKIWKEISAIRGHYKGRLRRIERGLKKLEKIREKHPDLKGKKLKEIRDGIEVKKAGKEAELQQKEIDLTNMGSTKIWKNMSVIQVQDRIRELCSERRDHPLAFRASPKAQELRKLEESIAPYYKLHDEIKDLKNEIKEYEGQIREITTVYNGIKDIISEVNLNASISQETKDYMNGHLTEFDNNYESEELESLLTGDMANSKLAMEARNEQEKYNKAVNRIGAFEEGQTPASSTTSTATRTTSSSRSSVAPIQVTDGKGKDKDKDKNKNKKKSSKNKKTNKNKGKSSGKFSCWELELMTEEQKQAAAREYYRKNGTWWEKLRAKRKSKTAKGRKKWEEYFVSQAGNIVDKSEYSQIREKTTDEWRRRLLHTVAAKKPSSKGYDLTDNERDDLYK